MSGSTIGGVVGAVIGAYFGNPQLGWMIGSAVGGAIDPDVIEGPRLRDAQGVTAAEGVPRPFGYGAFVCGGNLIQAGEVIERRVRSDGKGGPVTEESRGYLTFALRICEGPITGIRRVWWNNKLVYSATGEAIDKDSRKAASKLRFYLGDETQMPDPALEALPADRGGGVGNVPAYRGTAYMVADMLDITDSGVAIGNWKFEVVVHGTVTPVAPNIIESELLPIHTGSASSANFIQTYTIEGTIGRLSEISWQPSQGSEATAPVRFQVLVGNSAIFDSGWTCVQSIEAGQMQAWKEGVTTWIDTDPATGSNISVTSDPQVVGSYLATLGGQVSVQEFLAKLNLVRPAQRTNVKVRMILAAFNSEGLGADGYGVIDVLTADPDVDYYPLPEIANALILQDNSIAYPDWVDDPPGTEIVDRDLYPVADVVLDLADRVGVPDSQIDVSQVTQGTRGFMVGRQMEAGAAIRTLQSGYFFDLPEYDGKLRAILRGGPNAITINPDHLIEDSDDEETRAQVLEYPWKVNLIAPDPEANYEPAKQPAIRRTYSNKALTEVTSEVPIVFTRDENAKVAEVMLKALWESANGRRTITLPEEYSQLIPSDCPVLDDKRWRITKRDEGDGEYTFEMERDRVEAYASLAAGTSGVNPSAPVSTIRGPTMFWAGNLPRLRTQDIGPGVYVAGQGVLPGWYGYDLQVSYDGVTFDYVLSSSGATMGYLLSEFGSEPLQVQMYRSGQLDSATAAQLAARGNAAAISDEVVQFANADEDTGDAYDLTEVPRSLLGSDQVTHLAGETFVMLGAGVHYIPMDPQFIGKTIYFRPVSYGTAPENNPIYPFVLDPIFSGSQTTDVYTLASGEQYTTADGEPYLTVT